jgi:hypothetical protein
VFGNLGHSISPQAKDMDDNVFRSHEPPPYEFWSPIVWASLMTTSTSTGGYWVLAFSTVVRLGSMRVTGDVRSAIESLENHTGVIVPTYFGSNASLDDARGMLRNTAHLLLREVEDPRYICLSVDGSEVATLAAEQVAQEFGLLLTISEVNRGKLAAIRSGFTKLLIEVGENLEYVTVIDQDGDHFPNDLLNLIRCAFNVRRPSSTDRIVIIGHRRSPQRSLGFFRGELELLADNILLKALEFDAVQSEKPLPLQYVEFDNGYIDFHSGYKLFSIATAASILSSRPNFAGCSEEAYFRHACEAVMTLEAIKDGAVLATTARHTLKQHMFSTFDQLDRIRLIADKIIWPCKRLNVPYRFVSQWIQNYIPNLMLSTLTPQGKETLCAVQDIVASELST